MELLLATQNPGKAAEIQAMLADKGWQVKTASQIPGLADFDVVEDGDTLAANALKKATQFGQKAQVLTLADDTGLMVTSLSGAPGVHSKRYGATAHERNQKLVAAVDEATAQGQFDRSAEFVTCLCLYDPATEQAWQFEGQLLGQIALQESDVPAGEGVGYDSVFIPTGYTTTLADLGPSVKNQISHRHRALQQMVVFLESHYGALRIPTT